MTIAITKQNRNHKVFSIFLALYPVLCIYKAFGNFTIGDVILMGFITVEIIKGKCFKNIVPLFIIYGIYIFIAQQLNFITTSDNGIIPQISAATIRALKLLFYIFAIVCIAGSYLFDYSVFKKWLIIIGLVASFFLFYQYIMYFGFGRIVLGQIPGLEVYLKEYIESNLDYETFYSYSFRPCSIFLEPAMLAQYMIVPLSILLFSKGVIRGRAIYTVICSLAIILSTSGQGVLYLAIVFTYFSLAYIKRKSVSILVAILIISLSIVAYEIIEPFSAAVDRLVLGEDAQDARLGAYSYCFNLNSWDSIFGKGYGCIPNGLYMSGGAYVWYGAGLIGLLLAICLFIQVYFKNNITESRVLTILFFTMLWGTALFYNYMFFWFFTIIIAISHPAISYAKFKVKHA